MARDQQAAESQVLLEGLNPNQASLRQILPNSRKEGPDLTHASSTAGNKGPFSAFKSFKRSCCSTGCSCKSLIPEVKMEPNGIAPRPFIDHSL